LPYSKHSWNPHSTGKEVAELAKIEGSRRAASTALLWSAGDFWTQQVSQLLTFILVGNLLGPHVVGVMTMGIVVTLFLATFLESGITDALIQRAELDDAHFDSAFWLMLALGTMAGVALWIAAPLAAILFSESQLNDILPIMAMTLPCIAITACYTAILRRQLNFRQLATRSIFAYGAAFLTAVVMAVLGYGLASLVAFFVVSRVLGALLVVAVSGRWPGTRITRQALRDLIGFGKHRIAQQIVAYIGLQSSRILIGIFLGPTVLGLYSIAERIVAALNNGISGVLQTVAFPVLSSRQSDRSSFDWTMQKFLTFANLISLPMFVGLAVTSDRLVEVLFTPSWQPAALLLQILCIATLGGPTNYILMASTNALGRADIVLRLSLEVVAFRVAACFAAVQFSGTAVAAAVAISSLLSLPMFMFACNKLFAGKWLRLFRGVWVSVLATAVMAGTTLIVAPLLSDMNALLALAWQVFVGILTYTIAIGLGAPHLFRRVVRLFGPTG
jgi:O-antigen/teichoic acid export membrane protein